MFYGGIINAATYNWSITKNPTTFPEVEVLYDLEIETDNAYLNGTTLENFHIM